MRMLCLSICGALMVLPVSASALSCLPHSLEGAYQRVAADEAEYVVVHGRLTFDADLLPEVDMSRQADTPPRTVVPARLEGKSMTRRGFDIPFEQTVELDVLCYGPWCGSAATGQDVLAFVRRDAETYVLETNPCGGDLFGTPSAEMLEKVQACYAGEPCQPERP